MLIFIGKQVDLAIPVFCYPGPQIGLHWMNDCKISTRMLHINLIGTTVSHLPDDFIVDLITFSFSMLD